ncbi:ubiquinone/menaquinone biosynthesis C-methylase UbiE [Micromonospora luteifusca]|uniref:Ubiquinone/menaquinone biosynthesis C-methylase UbiE n=1 Tax=Micromonospora luteifusca TaxID=709860 RepID=A0ABS2LM68_9ACTN|nr:methyltransferase domain-containing protein [Micromonospora luteifusca]MBM7488963.1 ubiquinone/menaquinone biosynthesis C-methylase UbiE [Micromonospora luteifusca]
MSHFATATTAPDQIAYLDAAAATAVGVEYKQRFVDALGVQPGHTVVDIGCGPGTDLGRLADAVQASGRVVGVDRDPQMVAEAGRRLADRPTVEVRAGDAHELPLADATVDRARMDRVLMHVRSPAHVLAEVRRVLRPGGVFGMAEPDWDTLAVADEDVRTSRRFARFVAGRVRHPTIGRELVRLSAQAGLQVRSVEAIAVVFRDFDTADQILGLRRNSARAVLAGELTDADVQPWLQRLAECPMLAGFTFYLVTAQA